MFNRANALLALAPQRQLPTLMVAVGHAVWFGDDAALTALADEHGCASSVETQHRLDEGTALRQTLKHYSGAMFHYEGEWYWGSIDSTISRHGWVT